MPERGATPNVPRVRKAALKAVSALSSPLLPDQYLRIGVDIDGVRHWRAYSLTSEPEREDGWISITVKAVDTGTVSAYLVRHGRPGSIVGLGGVEGDFKLPEQLPDKLLFVSAGSGITPIMSMLRSLDRGEMGDVVVLHSARHA